MVGTNDPWTDYFPVPGQVCAVQARLLVPESRRPPRRSCGWRGSGGTRTGPSGGSRQDRGGRCTQALRPVPAGSRRSRRAVVERLGRGPARWQNGETHPCRDGGPSRDGEIGTPRHRRTARDPRITPAR
ncbi:hypothetical protein C1I99_12330 [Micromonospora deserti]|uniref:Uncharacterized protein n=1 Tax=Micromonospora deserti TaxID=2070366 RepID=A0A2W2DPD4_9ACTN|nr:hypothetical protein C1I99_12330 [Micromonospora deserti]